MNREILFQDLGTQPYKAIWDYQEQLLQENIAKKSAIREHQPALSNAVLAMGNGATTINQQETQNNKHKTTTNFQPSTISSS